MGAMSFAYVAGVDGSAALAVAAGRSRAATRVQNFI
jgi:hypothetical protein